MTICTWRVYPVSMIRLTPRTPRPAPITEAASRSHAEELPLRAPTQTFTPRAPTSAPVPSAKPRAPVRPAAALPPVGARSVVVSPTFHRDQRVLAPSGATPGMRQAIPTSSHPLRPVQGPIVHDDRPPMGAPASSNFGPRFAAQASIGRSRVNIEPKREVPPTIVGAPKAPPDYQPKHPKVVQGPLLTKGR